MKEYFRQGRKKNNQQISFGASVCKLKLANILRDFSCANSIIKEYSFVVILVIGIRYKIIN